MQQLVEKWSPRFISGFSLVFLAWFVFSEWGGLVRFGDYLAGAVAATPGSAQTIWTYYGGLPAEQLLPSLLVGVIFGMVTTVIISLTIRAEIRLPGFSAWAMFSGAGAAIIAYAAGMITLNALLVGALVAVIVAWALQPDMRAFLSLDTARRAFSRDLIPYTLLAMFGGAVGGALGSQVMAYATQHCTYAPDAPLVQRQIGVVVTAFGTLFALMPVWTLMLWRRRAQRRGGTSGYFRGFAAPLLWLLPTLLSLIVFLYYPATQIISLSLKLRRHPLPQERFVCLENYVNLAQDPIYQNSFIATMLITVAVVALAMSAALAIALLASQKVKYAGVYRTLLIWPYALSPVVTGVIFYTMFQQQTGLINYALQQTVGASPRWLTNPDLAPWVIVFASMWNILGFNILFYIAGLQNIPRDLMEAAEIDGANRVQRFLRMTLPLLSPFTFFLLVTNITYSFYGIYGAVDTLTSGGPPLGPGGRDGGATNVLIYKLYQDAFSPGSPAGSAAAQAMILFLMVAIVTLIQFRFIERRVTYAE